MGMWEKDGGASSSPMGATIVLEIPAAVPPAIQSLASATIFSLLTGTTTGLRSEVWSDVAVKVSTSTHDSAATIARNVR